MVSFTVTQKEVPAIKVCSILPCEREDAALMLEEGAILRACPDHIADFWRWTGTALCTTYPLKPPAGVDVFTLEVVFDVE